MTAAIVIMAALILVVGFHVVISTPQPGTAEGTAASSPTFNPDAYLSGAKEVVVKAIEDQDSYQPEVGCPTEVEETKGTLFTCEALVRNRLVPVTLEVISNVGAFVRVLDTDMTASEAAEFEWCRSRGDLEGRAACSAAYEAR